MRKFLISVGFSFLAFPAFGECASPEETFMSCTFENGTKAVAVCLEGTDVTYAFGRVGAPPQLALSVPISDIDYMPWPGISSIWEAMTFYVDNIAYVVSAGETRIYPDDENESIQHRLWGYIEVYENYRAGEAEKELAALNCDKGSVHFDWSQIFSEAKQDAGLCWTGFDQRWQACQQ